LLIALPFAILLALLGEPLFVVFGGLALFAFIKIAHINAIGIIAEFFRLGTAPAMVAIPLFTLAGYFLAESKSPIRLVRLADAWIGWLPGGVAFVVLISCAVFTSLTGASGVTIIALGGLLYPILQKEKYSERFTLGIITTSGSNGLLLPPSLPLIIYGVVSQTDVEKLFIAGVIPTALKITLMGIFAIALTTSKNSRYQKFNFREALESLKSAGWEVPIPLIIIGGVYSGFITAVEASAVVAFYVFFIEVFIYRDIKLREVPGVVYSSMSLVGALLIILGMALAFNSYLIDQQAPQQLFSFIKAHITSKFMFLVLLNFFLLIVGSLIDIFSAIVVIVPLIVPIAGSFGINPIHLGIIFLSNLEIGYVTPPVGMNLFVSSIRFQRPVLELAVASLPFMLVYLIALIIITYLPDLSLFLVRFYHPQL